MGAPLGPKYLTIYLHGPFGGRLQPPTSRFGDPRSRIQNTRGSGFRFCEGLTLNF